MPANRNALIRYKTIDNCLRNRLKKWTLERLIDTVSDALYEYEGSKKEVSRRTIQADIQMMRSDKLGYNAPIVVVNRKYYTYEDPGYSITNIPLSEQDLGRMNEAVEILKQFKGFSHFTSLNEVVQKLENHVYVAKNDTQPIIEFEKNERLKGLEFLDVIYAAVAGGKAMNITYQSFKARQADTFVFHVWWLKEFKNRWFAVGVKKKDDVIMNLALDRIVDAVAIDKPYYVENDSILHDDYYKDTMGVTVTANQRPKNLRIFVSNLHAPYVETKPLHHSQVILERRTDGIIIGLRLIINFELEKEILGFGEGMVVLAPVGFRKRIQDKLGIAARNYNDERHIYTPPTD